MVERLGFNPFNAVLSCQPAQRFSFQHQRSEAAAMTVNGDVATLAPRFRKVFASKNDVDNRSMLADKGIEGVHLQTKQAPNQIHLHLVNRIHAGDALDVQGSELGRRDASDIAMEPGGRQEREAVNAGGSELTVPFAGDRVGVAEDVKTVHPRFSSSLAPFRRGDQRHITEAERRMVCSVFGMQPTELSGRHRGDAELCEGLQVG